MSTKRKTYTADFKAKIVLEVLEAEQTLNEIASKYELLPANIKNWKKMFLENVPFLDFVGWYFFEFPGRFRRVCKHLGLEP